MVDNQQLFERWLDEPNSLSASELSRLQQDPEWAAVLSTSRHWQQQATHYQHALNQVTPAERSPKAWFSWFSAPMAQFAMASALVCVGYVVGQQSLQQQLQDNQQAMVALLNQQQSQFDAKFDAKLASFAQQQNDNVLAMGKDILSLTRTEQKQALGQLTNYLYEQRQQDKLLWKLQLQDLQDQMQPDQQLASYPYQPNR